VISRVLPVILSLAPLVSPPSDLETALGEARSFEAIGNAMRAEAAYRRAFLAAPEDPRALCGLADLAAAAGDPDGVLLFLAAARDRAPRDAALLSEMEARGVVAGSGEPESIVARYLAYAEGFGPSARAGSVPAGEPIRLDALLFTGIDAAGRPVPIDPFFSVSAGLSFSDRPAIDIRAKPRPSSDEWIDVGDAGTGVTERVPIVVVGPPAAIVLRDSRRPRDATGPVSAPPGDVVLVGAAIADAAGNRLYRPRLRWSAAALPAGRDLSSALAERDSIRPAAHFFEPHRNRLSVPPLATIGGATTIVVTAADAETGAAGTLEVRVDPAASRPAATPCALPFYEGSFESALAAARSARRPVFAVVAAHW